MLNCSAVSAVSEPSRARARRPCHPLRPSQGRAVPPTSQPRQDPVSPLRPTSFPGRPSLSHQTLQGRTKLSLFRPSGQGCVLPSASSSRALSPPRGRVSPPPPPTPGQGPLPLETPDLGRGLAHAGLGPSSCLQTLLKSHLGDCESDHLQHGLRLTWGEGVMKRRPPPPPPPELGICRGRGGDVATSPLCPLHPPASSPFPWAWDPLIGAHPAWLWKGVGSPQSLEQRNQNSQSARTSVRPLDRLQLFPQPRLHKAPGPRRSPKPDRPHLS